MGESNHLSKTQLKSLDSEKTDEVKRDKNKKKTVTFISTQQSLILLSFWVDLDQCLDDRQHNKLRFAVEWYR